MSAMISAKSELLHKTIYTDGSKVAVSLPFIDELKVYHPDGVYPLLEDPTVSKRAVVVGMFVLRPATQALTGSITCRDDTCESIYNKDLDWVFNVEGIDGGGLISNCDAVDGYRLAMQYAMSDAVIFGSNMCANDGVTTPTMLGYLWQAYSLCEWGHIKAADPTLFSKFQRNRELWQQMGYLSDRKYPAQIVFTRSGKHYENSKYFLQARIFHERHPTGEEIEVIILTSAVGAARIRSQAAVYGLADRIDLMLVVLPLSATAISDEDVDITAIPGLLFDRFGMRIVNHDGGHDLLHEFYATGSLCQMNITLCRNMSTRAVCETWPLVDAQTRRDVVATFGERVRYFFKGAANALNADCSDLAGTSEQGAKVNAARDDIVTGSTARQGYKESQCFERCIPSHFTFANVITDEKQNLAIVTFDCSKKSYFMK
jgi:hypothetical protein